MRPPTMTIVQMMKPISKKMKGVKWWIRSSSNRHHAPQGTIRDIILRKVFFCMYLLLFFCVVLPFHGEYSKDYSWKKSRLLTCFPPTIFNYYFRNYVGIQRVFLTVFTHGRLSIYIFMKVFVIIFLIIENMSPPRGRVSLSQIGCKAYVCIEKWVLRSFPLMIRRTFVCVFRWCHYCKDMKQDIKMEILLK